ncbi:MAG: hypothetical protein ABJE95_33115 [Byssovorax sp.]
MIHEEDRTFSEMFGLVPPSEWKSELGRGMNCRVRSGQALAPLRGRETSGDAPSRFLGVAFRFVFARDNVGVAPALAADPRGTMATRSGERGPNTPDKRCKGNRASAPADNAAPPYRRRNLP